MTKWNEREKMPNKYTLAEPIDGRNITEKTLAAASPDDRGSCTSTKTLIVSKAHGLIPEASSSIELDALQAEKLWLELANLIGEGLRYTSAPVH